MLLRHPKATHSLLVLCVCASSGAPACLSARPSLDNTLTGRPADDSALIAELKVKIPELMAKRNTPGLAVAFVDKNRVVWTEGFGFTDGSRSTRVTADTLFSVQSISKTYTTTGFLIAATKGRLSLDDRLKKHLPTFAVRSRFGNEEADKITFRHLLSHRASLPVEAPLGNNFDECACTFEEHIKSIAETWLIAPVGDRYSYSNVGVDLAGYVLGVRSRQKSFERFMKEEVFGPLSMNSTTFNQPDALRSPSLARGHIGERELPDIQIPMIPSGGMYSSARDMARFLSFHLTGRTINGKRLIAERLLKEMYTPQFSVPGQVAGYGLGLSIQPWHGGTFLNHAGGGYGYSAQQYWMPEYGIGVVVLSNAQSGSLSSDIADRVMLKMIEARKGSVPPNERSDVPASPTVTVEPDLLRRLAGTYKARFNLMTFQFEEGNLFQVSGNTKARMDARTALEFTSGNRRFVFRLNPDGTPTGVQVMSQSETEFMPFNDSPGDLPGPNRTAWQEHVGEYQGQIYGNAVTTRVFLRNQYLSVSWMGGLKLTEYQSGLFFTAEGESVSFQGNHLSLGNRPFVKK